MELLFFGWSCENDGDDDNEDAALLLVGLNRRNSSS